MQSKRMTDGGDRSRRDRRPSRKSGGFARRRRRRLIVVAILLALFAASGAYAATTGALGDGWDLAGSPSEDPAQDATPEIAEVLEDPIPEQLDTTPAAAAYRLLASSIPDLEPDSVQGVFESALDPSWAAVRVLSPDEGLNVLFLQKDGETWQVRKSVRADEAESPDLEKVILEEVPEDLVESIYPPDSSEDASGLLTKDADVGSLPEVEANAASPVDPSGDDVPEADQERVEEGLGELEDLVEDYDGVAGVYAIDPDGGYGYGVRPDEVFYSASVIKVPIMVAVYRRMDEGAFALNDSFATEPGDWAAGAGWYQWQPFGTYHTVEEYLEMMMTQSDNVATNALTRIVGGPEYVNEVSRSLGATNTKLYQKVSSERAMVTSLDNQTTPRDMATMLGKIATGSAASREGSEDMVELMGRNALESWLKNGLPEGTEAGNKAGWLYRVYNDTAVVTDGERPYVVAILSKNGPEDPQEAKPTIEGISEAVWDTQNAS